MSERDRASARRQAQIKGELAYQAGQPVNACPYKAGGAWSLAPFWRAGWYTAKNEAQREPCREESGDDE